MQFVNDFARDDKWALLSPISIQSPAHGISSTIRTDGLISDDEDNSNELESSYWFDSASDPSRSNDSVSHLRSGESAFGPKPYDPNAPRNAIIALIIFLVVPALAIWVPARAALGVGGIILAVPALLSMLFLWLIPPAGIIALIPIALWYRCASRLWREL